MRSIVNIKYIVLGVCVYKVDFYYWRARNLMGSLPTFATTGSAVLKSYLWDYGVVSFHRFNLLVIPRVVN